MKAANETPKSTKLEKRISNLIKQFRTNLYKNICRSLYEKDKLTFSFLIVLKILENEDMIKKD